MPTGRDDRAWTFAKAVALLMVAYGVALATFSPSGFPEHRHTGNAWPYVADKPFGEDGFLMLTVGWNLGAGRGPIYNQGRTTTGIQPLSTAIDGVLAAIVQTTGGDKWTLTRAALLVGFLELVLLAFVLAKLAAAIAVRFGHAQLAARASAFALVATLCSYALFRVITFGLETGLYLITIGLCVLYTLRHPTRAWRLSDAILFGLLCGAAGLARIDFVVVMFVFLSAAILSRRMSLAHAVVVGALLWLAVGPWLLWVHHVSGHWLPSSGLAEGSLLDRSSASERAVTMIMAAIQHATPWADLNLLYSAIGRLVPRGMLFAVKPIVLSAFAAAAAYLVIAAIAEWRDAEDGTLWLWAASTGSLLLVYPAFFDPTYFFLRYSAPLTVIALPAVAVGWTCRTSERPRTATLGPLLLAGVFVLSAVVTLHRGLVGDQLSIMSWFIEHEFPPSVRVGTFNSGIAGFFHENVVNLDGKMNSDALAALRSGTLDEYLAHDRIDVMIDWPEQVALYISPERLREHWTRCTHEVPDSPMACWQRRPAIATTPSRAVSGRQEIY
jgi:hypothetical protein